MRVHGLDQEQLVWRRWCIANNCNGDVQRFQQEYPLTPEEAFITSGACWFDTKVLFARLRELEENKKDVAHDVRRYGNENPDVAHDVRRNRRGRFVYEKIWDQSLQRVTLSEIRFEEQEDGPVTIWRQPAERTPYVMGGDTAGEGSDWFSAYVIDNTDASMCARIWMQNDEAEYTAQFWCLGRYFNFALATPEVNFSTYPIRTLQEWGYPRLYVRQAEDDYTHKPRSAFGWRTDRLTRPAMLTELKEFTEAHPEAIVDEELLREMLVFCKNRDGRPEALTGEHDDLVMGYGITLRIRDQQSAAKEPEPGKAGRYTEDMLEDWRAASPEQRAYLERIWGRPF